MPANSALSNSDRNLLLAKTHSAPSYLSYVPDTVIGTATVASTPSTSPIVQISVSSASAGWTSARVGQTVKITSSDGLTLRGYYRVNHSAPSASILYIGSITNADVGLLNMGIRTSGIVSGDICTIYERRDIWSVAPRWDSAGIVYQDYDKAVSNYNNTPEPIVNMTINGRAGDYCTYITTSTKAISAVVSVSRNLGSLTYSWTAPSGWTGVSGTNTTTLTGNAPPGAYWLYCTVTDAGGYPMEVARFVRIHNAAQPPVDIIIERDERDRQWRSMTVRITQSGTSVLPAKPRVVVWGDMTWAGSDIASANRSFTGYITSQPFEHVPAYHESKVEIVGVCGVLDMLKGYPAEFKYAANSTTWEELPANYSTIQFIEWWICRWRAENVVQTFNFTPHSTSTSTSKFKSYSVDPGSIFSQIQQIAAAYDCNVGSRSDGEILYARHPSMIADRTGVVTRTSLDNAAYTSASVQWERHPKCGFARLEGRWTDLNANVKVAGEAPGKNRYGQGTGQKVLQNKVVESQADANSRSGRLYAMENNEYPRITVVLPTNWDIFEPIDMQFVPVTIPADRSPTGSAITISAIPISVTKNWLSGAHASINIDLEGETDGVTGETGDVASDATNLYGGYSIDTPPVIESPGYGDETDIDPIAANGSGLLFTDDGHVAKFDGIGFSDGSPSDDQRVSIGTGIKMISNPWAYESLILYGNQGGLVTGDHTSAAPAWQSKDLAGSGEVGSWSQTFDFSIGQQGFSINTDEIGGAWGTYASGTGFTPNCAQHYNTITYWNMVQVSRNISSTTLTSVTITFNMTKGGSVLTTGPAIQVAANGSTLLINQSNPSNGTGVTLSWTGTQSNVTSLLVNLVAGTSNASCVAAGGSGAITKLVITGTGTNPFGGSGGSQDETFITDIQGSINHEGYFCWLSKRTVSSVDYVYFNYTGDFFRTRSSAQLARYASGMGYSIQLGSYGNPGSLVVLASAGDPGTTDTGIYKSLTSGSSFSKITGTSLVSGGGAIVVPYNVGGTANASTTPTYGYVRGVTGGSVQFRSYSGATVNIAAGSVPINGYLINSYTLDGNTLAIPFSDQKLYRSPDGGDTWSLAGTIPGAGVLGMTGWPTNPDFYWAYGSDCLASTDDGGATWTDQRSDYETFATSEWGGDGFTIVSAFGDLGAFMQEVTQ